MHALPAARRSRPGACGGFTLIEVLVVVFIIAVLISFVMLSIGVVRDDRDVDTEARRLASLVELVRDEAMLQGRDFGLEFTLDGYRFVEFDPLLARWNEVVGDDLLRPRSLPEGMEFDLFVEDRRIRLAREFARTAPAEDDDEDEPDQPSAVERMFGRALIGSYAPHAMIMSSGDLTPFELMLRRPADDVVIRLAVLPGGIIEIGDDSDDNFPR